MHRHTIPRLIAVALLLTLSGCFREASDNGSDDEQSEVSLQDIQAEQSQTLRPTVNTATPPDTLEPIPINLSPTAEETLIVGGPPAEGDEANANTFTLPTNTATVPAENTDTPAPTLTPTDAPPSATPTMTQVPLSVATLSRPGFADTGISPTPSRTPSATSIILATPTDIVPVDDCIYLVQGGDTILQISRDLDIDVDAIYAVNPELAFNPDNLAIGQQIRIPDCISDADGNRIESTVTDSETTVEDTNATSAATRAPTIEGGFRVHVVQSGETLFRISINYGTTVEAIVAANDSLVSENTPIFPGDELLIPPESE